jgi:flagellar hook-associated protein FlgK
MSLYLALNNALSGLNVSQAALAVVSNNIANANTPGYSRQIIEQSPLLLDGTGAGARIDAISRKVDAYLQRSIQRESSHVGRTEPIADYYERIQILLGQPGSSNSLDEYVQSFFNSLQKMAESPDRVSIQASALNTAEVLARELSGLAYALEDLRLQADQDIKQAVGALNREIASLDSLNVAIERAAALGLSTATLLDERDMALEEIATAMNISIYYKPSGAVNVFTSNGVALVDDAKHQLRYVPASGISHMAGDTPLNPLQMLSFNQRGELTNTSELISGGQQGQITSRLNGGSIEGFRQLRDELIPALLQQMDELAAQLRDAINAVHNDGSGFPPATSLTGTRMVTANETFDWSGTVQIAVLNPDGTAIESPYANEIPSGVRPLDLDLSSLTSGFGDGRVSTQTIIDEINNHFNAPPVKASLGNLNNIQLVSNSLSLPGSAPVNFNFDLDLENIANFGSQIWVSDVSITDDTMALVASSAGGEVTSTIPSIGITGYDFTNGSTTVGVNTSGAHGYAVGQRIFLQEPTGGPYAGGSITSGQLGGYYTVTSVGPNNRFEIALSTAATATVNGEAPADPATSAQSSYQSVEAGEKIRTRQNGTFSANLIANTSALYYDVTITVTVLNEDPNADSPLQTGTLTYRIYNNTTDLRNKRIDVEATTGAAERHFPSRPHQYLFARLVDENGVELPNVNGNYRNQQGYLQLVANPLGGQPFTLAINEGDSKQLGKIRNQVPPQAGTNRAFSHYYELNNLFASNNPTATGDQLRGSALNFAVEQRLLDNPSLISTGRLERPNQSNDPNAPRNYAVERYIGNNSVAQRLAGVANTLLSFNAAGGLPQSSQTINGFIGDMLGFIASQTVTAKSNFLDANTLLQGLVQRADAISGVNIDEELASITLYQNAYSASARILSVTNDLFESLLGTFR